MAKPRVNAGGGFAALRYSLKLARQSGGLWRFYQRMRGKNACKTCALGMGGQKGGMVNEAGHFPEVCKKSFQAQAADMMGPIEESFFQKTPIGQMDLWTPAQFEALGRLAFPVIAESGATHYRRVSWDEALKRLATALRQAPAQKTFFYSSGRSSNEAAFLLQLVARVYGCSNIHNCSFYCHNASSVALGQVYGGSTGSVALDDVAKADCVIVAGANPASNHPRLLTQLVHLRRRGGVVIAVNPMKELGLVRFRVPSDVRSMLFGSKVTDLYLQPHIGGDVALFKAILKQLIASDRVEKSFIAAHCEGWDELCDDLSKTSWDVLIQSCGVSREHIDRAALAIGRAQRGIVMWSMGLTHHQHGVDNILALANVALARGWIGRPGCGLMPIRGHSNVQGIGSVGFSPQLKVAFADKLSQLYGIDVSTGVNGGLDTYASMEAAARGDIDVAMLLGGNLFASNPDRRWSSHAMRRIGLTFSLTTKLNEGHVHGRGQTSIIVPVFARDEEPQSTTQESMFSYVRLSDGGLAACEGELRSEVEVIATMAEQVLDNSRFDWSALRSHRKLREEIAKVVPGYAAIENIEEHGEFQVSDRTLHTTKFATKNGKATFSVTSLPALLPSGENSFRLMTLRSEGQFNSVVYDEEDLYRGNTRRDVVMMAASDAKRLGVTEGERVVVKTEVAQMIVVVSHAELPSGNIAMYYPEANRLVPRLLDARSKTPAFKSVAAQIERVSENS